MKHQLETEKLSSSSNMEMQKSQAELQYKYSELSLKEQELMLKERELELKAQEINAAVQERQASADLKDEQAVKTHIEGRKTEREIQEIGKDNEQNKGQDTKDSEK